MQVSPGAGKQLFLLGLLKPAQFYSFQWNSACCTACLLLLASSIGSKRCCGREGSFFMSSPRFRGSRITFSSWQVGNVCIYVQHPWELLTDALNIAWMMLSQGNILFSLSLLPHPFLPLFLFSAVSVVFWYSVRRWKVDSPEREGMEAAVVLLEQCSWAFSQKKNWEKCFLLGYFFLIA